VNPKETVAAAVGRMFAAGVAGVEVVDRDLTLCKERVATVVAVESGGRMVLVIACETLDDGALLGAVDALAFSKLHLPALVRHVASPRVRGDAPPAIWLVARQLDPAAKQRLAALDRSRVRAFEIVRLESRRGVSDELSEVVLDLPAAGLERRAVPAFLEQLAAAERALAELIIDRARHLDEDVELVQHEHSLEWRLRGSIIAGLASEGGVLRGSIPGRDALDALDCAAAAEAFLEGVIGRYLDLCGDLDDAPAQVRVDEPLLTAEELAAFDASS
jgi:hypothetical protein